MFDNISPSYDFLNGVLSLGIHNIWRKKAIQLIGQIHPSAILDVATGTADFAIASASLRPKEIVGVDISEGMLSVGRIKVAKKNLGNLVRLEKGDSENLSFSDGYFDAVTVGFGVRNFGDLEKGLSEIKRVLRKGGKVAILEPAAPTRFPMKNIFNFYFRYLLPFFGRLISGDKAAYTYLPESVRAFPNGAEFAAICKKVGFVSADYHPLTFGICSLYLLEK